MFLCDIRARANPFAGFQTGRNGMHEISPDELFNMFFNVSQLVCVCLGGGGGVCVCMCVYE